MGTRSGIIMSMGIHDSAFMVSFTVKCVWLMWYWVVKTQEHHSIHFSSTKHYISANIQWQSISSQGKNGQRASKVIEGNMYYCTFDWWELFFTSQSCRVRMVHLTKTSHMSGHEDCTRFVSSNSSCIQTNWVSLQREEVIISWRRIRRTIKRNISLCFWRCVQKFLSVLCYALPRLRRADDTSPLKDPQQSEKEVWSRGCEQGALTQCYRFRRGIY